MAQGCCPQAPTQLSSSPAAPWPVVPAARLLPGCSRAWGSPHPGPQAAPEPSGLEPGERAPRTTWPAGGKAWLCEESSRCYCCPPIRRGPLGPWVPGPLLDRVALLPWGAHCTGQQQPALGLSTPRPDSLEAGAAQAWQGQSQGQCAYLHQDSAPLGGRKGAKRPRALSATTMPHSTPAQQVLHTHTCF